MTTTTTYNSLQETLRTHREAMAGTVKRLENEVKEKQLELSKCRGWQDALAFGDALAMTKSREEAIKEVEVALADAQKSLRAYGPPVAKYDNGRAYAEAKVEGLQHVLNVFKG